MSIRGFETALPHYDIVGGDAALEKARRADDAVLADGIVQAPAATGAGATVATNIAAAGIAWWRERLAGRLGEDAVGRVIENVALASVTRESAKSTIYICVYRLGK